MHWPTVTSLPRPRPEDKLQNMTTALLATAVQCFRWKFPHIRKRKLIFKKCWYQQRFIHSFILAFCQEVLTYWRRKTANLKFFPNFLHFKHMRLRGVGMTLKWVDSLTWATLEGGTLADMASNTNKCWILLRAADWHSIYGWLLERGQCLILWDVFLGAVDPSWKARGSGYCSKFDCFRAEGGRWCIQGGGAELTSGLRF